MKKILLSLITTLLVIQSYSKNILVDKEVFSERCDNKLAFYQPPCLSPTNLSVSNISSTSAIISWLENQGSEWYLEYKLASQTSWNNATSISSILTNSYSLTSLLPSTTYNYRLKTICGIDESTWSVFETFTTSCSEITTFPWNEGFESLTNYGAYLPQCWSATNLGVKTFTSNSSNLFTNGFAHTGNSYVFFTSYSNDSFSTPIFSLPQDSSYEFSFWYVNDGLIGWDSLKTELWNATTNTFVSIIGEPLKNIRNTSYLQYIAPFTINSNDNYYIKIICNSTYQPYTFCLDDVSLYSVSCLRPRNFHALNIASTSADLTWDIGNSSSVILEYKLYESNTWTQISESSNTYTITSLIPSSTYRARIRTDCGNDYSTYNYITFSTQCSPINVLPWSEGFESIYTNDVLPACWDATRLGVGLGCRANTYNISFSGNAHSHNGTKCIFFDLLANNDAFYTPSFQLEDTNYQFSFYYSTDNYNFGNFSLRVELRNAITNSIVQILGNPLVIGDISDSYVQYLSTFSILDSTIPYYIAIVATNNSAYNLSIDDVSLDYLPPCSNINNLRIEPSSLTSLSLYWDKLNESSDFIVGYSISPPSPFNNNFTSQVYINSNVTFPYSLSGFSAGDTIYVGVKRDCSNSNWTTKKIIIPLYANPIPFFANFNNVALDTVWTFNNALTQTNHWFIGALGAMNTGRGMYVSADNGLTAGYDGAIQSASIVSTMVNFDFSPSFTLSFNWQGKGSPTADRLNVYLLPLSYEIDSLAIFAPPVEYKINTTILNNADTWKFASINLNSSYSNTIKRLAFVWENNDISSGWNPPPGGKIDNISITATNCGFPYDLTLDYLSQNGQEAYISWTNPPTNNNSYVIKYKEHLSSTWIQISTQSNPFTLTGLNSGTNYDVKVNFICTYTSPDGSTYTNSSPSSNIISFQTPCTYLSVPSLETFNNFDLNSSPHPLPNCWELKQGTLCQNSPTSLIDAYYGWFANTSQMQNVGENHFMINSIGEETITNYWLITPSYKIEQDSVAKLEFDILLSNFYVQDTAYALPNFDDKFAVVISTDNGNTWEYSNAKVWNYTDLNIFTALQHIIIPLINPITQQPYQGNIKIGFYLESLIPNENFFLHLDNVAVNKYEECQRPMQITVSNISSTEATINFNAYGATNHSYVLSSSSSINTSNGTIIQTINNPFTLTGLMPQTQYKIWVRNDCTNSSSFWSDSCVFTTEAIPATIPYYCNFEDATENLFWNKKSNGENKWIIGSAAGNGPSSPYIMDSVAAYISNNGISYGMNYAYAFSYIYRDIDFGTNTDTLYLSFDWKYQGYTTPPNFWPINNSQIYVFMRDLSVDLPIDGVPINQSDNYGELREQSTWKNEEIKLNNLTGVKRLIFMFYKNATNVYLPAPAIDNICITSCKKPSKITVSEIINSTATISWNDNNQASSWIISLGTQTDTINTNNHTYNNLIPGIPYTVYVRSNCGNSLSSWATLTFTIDSIISPEIITLPATEITNTSASLNGVITPGTENIQVQGFEYKLNTSSFVNSFDIMANSGNIISANISNLIPDTVYEVRAYAQTQNFGKLYGDTISFRTETSSLNIVDNDPIKLQLYPNPAINSTTLLVKGINSEIKITITDVLGRVINSENIKPENNTIKKQISLSKFSKGVYYIRVQDETFSKTLKLIVK